MNRIYSAFENKKAFIGFLTAGDPDLQTTENCIMEMEKAGADLIEIGIPFSDPIAEGSVIQAANVRALKSGTNLNKIFELVKTVRKKTNIPLVFLTYINPVFNYGYDKFFKTCSETGIDGIITPDLPYEEKEEIIKFSEKYEVPSISLIAPTSKERIKSIAKNSKGFIYLVSSMGVTGMRSEITTDLTSIVKLIRETSNTPIAIGFGINTPVQAVKYSQIADGVIVGSAIVNIIGKYGKNAPSYVYDYVKTMKDSINKPMFK